MRDLAVRLAGGFLAGLGFAVALALSIWAWSAWEAAPSRKSAQEAEAAGLVIASHRERSNMFGTAILGTVTNTGTKTWKTVEIVVELLDEHGDPLDICSDYIASSIEPSSSRHFKVNCGDDLGGQALAHASYEVRIDGADPG